MKHQPAVSVVMSAYNSEKYIGAAIKSVLGQTYPHFEFIIIDDCSSDNTANIISSFNDERLIFIKNEENRGIRGYVDNLNRLNVMAKGKYIARIDHDDIWHPHKLETQIHFLESNPDITLVGCYKANKIDANDNKLGTISLMPEHMDWNHYMLKKNPIIHPSVIFRASDIAEYRWKLFYCEDYDFHLQNLSKGLKYHITDEILMDYRILEGSLSHNKKTLISALFRQQASTFYQERLENNNLDSYEKFNPEDIINVLSPDYPNSYILLKTALHFAFIAGLKNDFKIIFNKIKTQHGSTKIPILYKMININFNLFYKAYQLK